MAFPSGLQFLLKNQLTTLWGFPCCFSLAASNIFTLALIYVSLINQCFVMFLLGIIYLGLSVLPGFEWLFPSHVREVFSYYPFKYFLKPFLSSPSRTLMMQTFVLLMLAQWPLRLSFLSFFFPLLSSTGVISNTPSSSSLTSLFRLNYCAIDSFSCIFHSSYSIFHLCSLNFLC